jgi:hypothetical protein
VGFYRPCPSYCLANGIGSVQGVREASIRLHERDGRSRLSPGACSTHILVLLSYL